MAKTSSYNYVKMSDIRDILTNKDLFDISFVKTEKGKHPIIVSCDVDKIDHIKLVVHNSLSFEILCSKKARNKYGISREVRDDILIYNIPIKTLRKFQKNNINFMASMKYNGEISAFKDKSVLSLAKWIYVCSKRKVLAEIIV